MVLMRRSRAVYLGLVDWMPTVIAALVIALFCLCNVDAIDLSDRYLVFNLQQEEVRDETFRSIAALTANRSSKAPKLGVGTIISYLAMPREQCLAQLQECFRLAELHDLAIVVQLDGEQWWQGRPDLWNWWDKEQSGFNPENAMNVEWSGWGAEHALKIAWRNWGKQLRVLPPPNLLSPRYRAVCHEELKILLDEIVRWRTSLELEQSHLLIGVKVGWESSVGVNAYYYSDGNKFLGSDPLQDPVQTIQEDLLPDRGFKPIGYAAVKTAGLARGGKLQENHLTEVVRCHLTDLALQVREVGLPRHQVFVHCGGWAQSESLYSAALNPHSCPGWSFYRFALDPLKDQAAMTVLSRSDAPYWAAPEGAAYFE